MREEELTGIARKVYEAVDDGFLAKVKIYEKAKHTPPRISERVFYHELKRLVKEGMIEELEETYYRRNKTNKDYAREQPLERYW